MCYKNVLTFNVFKYENFFVYINVSYFIHKIIKYLFVHLIFTFKLYLSYKINLNSFTIDKLNLLTLIHPVDEVLLKVFNAPIYNKMLSTLFVTSIWILFVVFILNFSCWIFSYCYNFNFSSWIQKAMDNLDFLDISGK